LCKAFRRLKHKTQVFWAPRNDHFRTRLTHTSEVVQTAHDLGTKLGLNVDLIDAIAYAHDIGHPPFGHAGERTVQQWIKQWFRDQAKKKVAVRHPEYDKLCAAQFAYDHHFWAWKILQKQEEQPYAEAEADKGLNLTSIVQEGIRNPSLANRSSLEAQVVGIVDDLVWINHDAEDFHEAGIRIPEDASKALLQLGATRKERMLRAIEDIVNHSNEHQKIAFSHKLKDALDHVAEAEHKIYRTDQTWVRRERGAEVILRSLLDFFMNTEDNEIKDAFHSTIGRGTVAEGGSEEISLLTRIQSGVPRLEAVVDHVVKMTDTFALDIYRRIFSPETLDYYF